MLFVKGCTEERLFRHWTKQVVGRWGRGRWGRYETGNKTCYQNFVRKRISMSGLKVPSLVRKYVFYRPELTGKRVPHGTEIKFLKFQNILTDRAQRVDEKNVGHSSSYVYSQS